jgi:hypothetical protein
MAKDENLHFRIHRKPAPLPSESDFDPFGGHLDAQCAWRNFGELSLKEAYERFVSAPEIYQEDFMFMGSKAFSYYLPVIDRYIREITGLDEGDDCEVAILGSGVAAQFDWSGAITGDPAIHEIEELSNYVLTHLSQYSLAAKDQRRIGREWALVDKKLAEYRTRSDHGAASKP